MYRVYGVPLPPLLMLLLLMLLTRCRELAGNQSLPYGGMYRSRSILDRSGTKSRLAAMAARKKLEKAQAAVAVAEAELAEWERLQQGGGGGATAGSYSDAGGSSTGGVSSKQAAACVALAFC